MIANVQIREPHLQPFLHGAVTRETQISEDVDLADAAGDGLPKIVVAQPGSAVENKREVQRAADLFEPFQIQTGLAFVSTVGGAPLAVIKQYIENQKYV